jgi:GNAT superfamily N-acetyltransferase
VTIHPLPVRSRAHDHVVAPLRGGGVAVLRPLRPGETDALRAVFDGLSPASRTSRYLVGMGALPPWMLTALADVDGAGHVAWLASVGGEPAGIARFVRVAPDTAEIAFEVVDAHQGRGLGTVLLDTLTTVACMHGVRRLRATVHPANVPSLRLLARLAIPLTLSDGLLEGEGPLQLLSPARVNRRAVVALAARAGGQVGSCPPAHAAAH